jgi:hypothetical protein
MVDILLMRGRRLKIFCSTYIVPLVGLDGTGFGVIWEKWGKIGRKEEGW